MSCFEAPAVDKDADWRKSSKDKGAQAKANRPSWHPKKEKDMDARELSILLPYLESATETYVRKFDQMNSRQGTWEKEYQSITDGNGSAATGSNNPRNAGLNRYRNIVSYDHSRVMVQPNSNNDNNDYLNANYITGYKQTRGYIACQGPVPGSFNSFWQMMWDENAEGIVMVTNEVEGNKLKCHRYWPSREQPTEKYGNVSVTLAEERPHSTFLVRKFILSVGSAKQEVYHFQYTVWPDHGVPNTTSEMLGFRKAVRKLCPKGPPLVVHCSAGVGRTGSFLVIDTMVSRMEQLDPDLDIQKLVREIRKSRNFLVQTLVQYQYCHRAVKDALQKHIASTVRAIKKKSGDVLEQAKYDLEELQVDIAETLDAYVGDERGEEQFLTLGRKTGRGIIADIRYTEFDKDADVAVASTVPPDVRAESLAASQDLWRVRGNVPMSAEEHGYFPNDANDLGSRVQSLQIQTKPDAWRKRYQEVADNWVSEVYDVTAALNPIESRMMSLASQLESWKLRGKHFRDVVTKEQQSIKTTYDNRLTSLESTITGAEGRWKERGDGLRTAAVREHEVDTTEDLGGMENRIGHLMTWAKTSSNRGTIEGRVVDNPAHTAQAELDARLQAEAERMEALQQMEKDRHEKELAERTKRQEELRRSNEKPVQPFRTDGAANMTPKQMVQLNKVAAPAKVHPMLAQVKKGKGKGKK